ncbi:anthranilate synthase component II [Crepidotus variabilis]|uniref:Multifunctional tryptophan biosynthesis protein n=1 Tax=Crepidotus variabilis TaxID=179855 RepID=A0A9P6JKS3_9AGAR|nr:anthranilate synthase component II [Crepidotus variabilis]
MAETTLPKQLEGQLDVLMIDNFDSFTWNLYQQLCLQGAEVTVIRNDAISPSLFPQLKINSLVVSPGPGHPQTDSGISNAAIQYFQGKVPVLGVCMGLECLVDVHGGKIAYAGEIKHGKVSRVRHDSRGCFRGIPQGIKSIRYHSLSAAHSSLPPDLAITAATEESGVIMGLRHRKYTVEAVQYHPESILSEGGDELIKNFLSLRGGLWEDNPEARVLDVSLPPFPYEALPTEITSKPGATSRIPSILDKIYTQRLQDVSDAQKTPGSTLTDLQTLLSLNIAPTLIPFVSRIKQTEQGRLALFAEIKRASPSKGPISVGTSPAAQALTYALSGAHTISVLTEPKWFLGTLQDMQHVRQAIAHLPNRPAVLRKDFILSKYQVLESRLYGADTLLLIVSMLPEPLLRDLYAFSLELGMEPLVEVNNAKEMEMALSLPAKVIGVNNRNLHDFNVDMGTTSRLTDMVAGKDVILLALSGITGPEDVRRYAAEGVKGVLIGESLMRAKDPAAFIKELLSIPATSSPATWSSQPPVVKICGIKTRDEALAVTEAGADLIGLVFAQKSKRFVDIDTAREIAHAIRDLRFKAGAQAKASSGENLLENDVMANTPWLTTHATRLSLSPQHTRPLLVGVFQDASLDVILHTISEVQLDLVQLHGSEPIDWAMRLPVPVIRAFHIGSDRNRPDGITQGGVHQHILLDSTRDDGSGVSGGSGKVVDWDLARQIVNHGEIVTDTFKGKGEARSAATRHEATSSTSSVPIPVNAAPEAPTANGADSVPAEGDVPAAASTATPSAASTAPAPLPEVKPSRNVPFLLPIILAGGLNPDNVAKAIAKVHPWAVDVSGGVENADGSGKDLEKVRAFINHAKGLTPSPDSEESEEEDSPSEAEGE